MLIRFWQNIGGLLLALVCCLTGACPISARYRSVLATSMLPAMSVTMPSFSGIRAAFLGWFLAASSSSSAWEVAIDAVVPQVGRHQRGAAERRVEEVVDEGVVAAVDHHPGARHASLVGRVVLRGPAGGRVEQVAVVTLSLGSWSTMSKLRAVGQARRVPSAPAGRDHVPRDPGGRDVQPSGALQGEGGLEEGGTVAERHLAEGRARFAVGAAALAERVRRRADLEQDLAVEPDVDGDDRVAWAASAPPAPRPAGALGDDQGVVHVQRPGPRVQDGGLDERPQVERIDHLAAGGRR